MKNRFTEEIALFPLLAVMPDAFFQIFNSGSVSAGVRPSELPGGLSGSVSVSGPPAVSAVLLQIFSQHQQHQWCSYSQEQPLPQPKEV